MFPRFMKYLKACDFGVKVRPTFQCPVKQSLNALWYSTHNTTPLALRALRFTVCRTRDQCDLARSSWFERLCLLKAGAHCWQAGAEGTRPAHRDDSVAPALS